MRLSKAPVGEFEWTITLTQKERDSLENFLHMNGGVNKPDHARKIALDLYNTIEGRMHSTPCEVCKQ